MPTLHTNGELDDDAPLTFGGLLLWLGYVGLRTGRLLAEALQPALELVLSSVYVISSILQACPALTTMPRSLVFMAVDLITEVIKQAMEVRCMPVFGAHV